MRDRICQQIKFSGEEYPRTSAVGDSRVVLRLYFRGKGARFFGFNCKTNLNHEILSNHLIVCFNAR